MCNQLFFRSDASTRQLSAPLVDERRQCTAATRNQRPVAIRSLARFVALHSPEHIEWIPTLKTLVALVRFSYEGPPDDL
jgi:hypothetical protein